MDLLPFAGFLQTGTAHQDAGPVHSYVSKTPKPELRARKPLNCEIPKFPSLLETPRP